MLLALFWSLFLCLTSAQCKLESLSKDSNSRVSLSMCIMFGVEKFNIPNNLISVSLSVVETSRDAKTSAQISNMMFPHLFSSEKWTFTIWNFTNPNYRSNRETTRPSLGYIIQIRERHEFAPVLQRLKQVLIWNPRAKFLVMSAQLFNDSWETAQEIVQKMSDEMIVNGIILLPSLVEPNEYDVFSWYPYHDGACKNIKIYKIDTCYFGKTGRKSEWFVPKIPKTLNNCTYMVRVVEWPPYTINLKNHTVKTSNKYYDNYGIDVNVLNTVAKAKNITFMYIKSKDLQSWGDILDNGTITGNLAFLKNKDVSFAIGGYALTYVRAKYFDLTHSYVNEGLVWCTPAILVDRDWDRILTIVEWKTWVLVFILYFSVTFLTWKISIHNNNESTSYKSYSNNLQNCYAIFYGISVKTLPRSNMSRLFIGLFIFLSFNMDSAYQTYFTSILTSHHEDFLYNNVDDILKANLKMKILNNDLRYFTGIKSQKFWDFMEICMDIKECLIDVALNKTSVISTPFLFKEYVLNSLVSKNKRPLLNCFKKRINNFPVTIVMKKGFPLGHSINNVILRLLGAGLVNKWEKDILREKAPEDIFKVVQDYDDGEYDYNMKERPFKLHNFLPVFQILCYGWIFSAICFVGEICMFKINKWYTKRNVFV